MTPDAQDALRSALDWPFPPRVWTRADMSPTWVTIPDVSERLGIKGVLPVDNVKKMHWAAGRAMQKLWKAHTREQPFTPLTRKTNAGGSHDIAHYPAGLVARIEYELKVAAKTNGWLKDVLRSAEIKAENEAKHTAAVHALHAELDHDVHELPPADVTDKHADMMAMGARCDLCPLSGCKGPVPAEANPGAKFAAFGKHPGDSETKHGRPYVGVAGTEIGTALSNVGVKRADVHWTYVVACQPPGNDLKRVLTQITKRNAKRKREHGKARTVWRRGRDKARAKSQPYATPEPPLLALEPTPVECCTPRLMAELAPFTRLLPMGSLASKLLLGAHANVMQARGGMVEGLLRYDEKTNTVEVLDEPEAVDAGEDDTDVLLATHTRVRILPVFEPAFVSHFPRWAKAFRTDIARAVAWFDDRLVFREPEIIYNPKPAALGTFLCEPGAVYAYDVETDGIESLSASMRCIAIGTGDKVVVVGLRSVSEPHKPLTLARTRALLGGRGQPQQSPWYTEIELAQVLALIKAWLLDPLRVKVGHNAGYYDYLNVFSQLGVRPVNTVDTMMLHRLVESELPHNLGFVASIYAPAVKAWKSDRTGRKLHETENDHELHHYCALDVANTHRVLTPLVNAVQIRGQAPLIAKDHRVQGVCAHLHEVGMHVNQDVRQEEETALVNKAVTLRKEIRDLSGNPDFNANSRDQLAALWFDEWKLEHPASLDPELRYTASGSPSTADVVVRALLGVPSLTEQQRSFLLKTRAYKKAQKVLGTYVAKLRLKGQYIDVTEAVDEDDDADEREYRNRYGIAKKGIVWPDGRVRPGYNAHVTNVGRLSSSSPWNAQNVPRWLRRMIEPAPGHIFVGADADQFHIRIFSALWGVERYLASLSLGADPHAMTAFAVFADRFKTADGFPGGEWKGDYFIPTGVGDWGGNAKKMRDLSKRVQFASSYAAGVDTVWRVITSAEDKGGNLSYLDLSMREVRHMHSSWLGGVPEVPAGWDNEQSLFDAYGYLVDPVDGRRKDFLDGGTKQELANARTLMTEAALMNGCMLDATDAMPWGKWGRDTGMLTQTHDSMFWEVPDTGVYVENGTFKASPGTPAWEAFHVLKEVLNYDGASKARELAGVRFTSVPTIGRSWADVG